MEFTGSEGISSKFPNLPSGSHLCNIAEVEIRPPELIFLTVESIFEGGVQNPLPLNPKIIKNKKLRKRKKEWKKTTCTRLGRTSPSLSFVSPIAFYQATSPPIALLRASLRNKAPLELLNKTPLLPSLKIPLTKNHWWKLKTIYLTLLNVPP